MTAVDYVILGILLVSAIAGLMRGFLREVCSLVTWILAFWAAWHFGPVVEPYLGGRLADPPFSTWAGRVIVFVLVLIVGSVVGAVVAYLVRLSLFNALDRLLGFVLGAARGVVILGLLAIIGQAARLDGEAWWKHSKLVPYVASVAKGLRAIGGDRLERGLSSVDL
jgi:membrane protein required for colicin V production